MEKQGATGPLLKFQQYVAARRSASSSSPTPPTTPRAGPSSPAPLAAAPPSLSPSGADPALHRKLDRLERKMDALTELVRRLVTGEGPPSATDVPPDGTPDVLEASVLATLA